GSPGRGEGGPAGLALHGAAKKGGDPAALEAALKARGLSGGDLSVSSDSDSSQASSNAGNQPMLWPAWVYCTRYSDRPSSGKRCSPLPTAAAPALGSPGRRRPPAGPGSGGENTPLAFRSPSSSGFILGLFFVFCFSCLAKIKKATGSKNSLAVHLMAQGLYNHSTTAKDGKSDSE
ncbi:HME2 protein, partial [Buphagus erythrorhynchus]|nr:HME2 protein [Buphagus erythrorhynchus]